VEENPSKKSLILLAIKSRAFLNRVLVLFFLLDWMPSLALRSFSSISSSENSAFSSDSFLAPRARCLCLLCTGTFDFSVSFKSAEAFFLPDSLLSLLKSFFYTRNLIDFFLTWFLTSSKGMSCVTEKYKFLIVSNFLWLTNEVVVKYSKRTLIT